jgi:hypothetical protein
MRARLMDHDGQVPPRRARARAMAAAALGLYGALMWACFFTVLCFPRHR